jgi:hypothetical protein
VKRTYSIISVSIIVVFGLFLMGMSGAISPNQSAVASPFDAKVKDTMNNEVTISSVTFDGKTLFSALLGKGKVQIPFENIERIDVKDDTICLKLAGAGTMCNLKVSGVSKIYGKTPYGAYQIAFKDVTRVELFKAKP